MADPVGPTGLALALAALLGREADTDMDDRRKVAKGKLRPGPAAKPDKGRGYRLPAAWSRRRGYDAPGDGGSGGTGP